MARVSRASGNWLVSLVAGFGAGTHVPKDVGSAELMIDLVNVGRLSREVCAIPEVFAGARRPLKSFVSDGMAEPSVSVAEQIESESRVRVATLALLSEQLRNCHESLNVCGRCMPPSRLRRLQEALDTLETEYVRLRDAQRFLAARRHRQNQTGEADDDPEFTIVLERIVYAADQGDEVEESVAKAVQAIAAELLPYVAGQR